VHCHCNSDVEGDDKGGKSATPVSTPTGVTAHPDGTVTDSKGNVIEGSSGGPGARKRFPRETPDEKAELEGVPCKYCGDKTTNKPRLPKTRTNDHRIARSQGGNNSPENRDPDVCLACNASKRDRNLWDWIRSKFGG